MGPLAPRTEAVHPRPLAARDSRAADADGRLVDSAELLICVAEAAGTLRRVGWLGDRLAGLDKRNQSVSDYLLDHPDAGTKGDPYAKPTKARRVVGAAGLILIALATAAFGLAGMFLVGVPLLIVVWRLDYHPWVKGYSRTVPTRSPDSDADRRP